MSVSEKFEEFMDSFWVPSLCFGALFVVWGCWFYSLF